MVSLTEIMFRIKEEKCVLKVEDNFTCFERNFSLDTELTV